MRDPFAGLLTTGQSNTRSKNRQSKKVITVDQSNGSGRQCKKVKRPKASKKKSGRGFKQQQLKHSVIRLTESSNTSYQLAEFWGVFKVRLIRQVMRCRWLDPENRASNLERETSDGQMGNY